VTRIAIDEVCRPVPWPADHPPACLAHRGCAGPL